MRPDQCGMGMAVEAPIFKTVTVEHHSYDTQHISFHLRQHPRHSRNLYHTALLLCINAHTACRVLVL